MIFNRLAACLLFAVLPCAAQSTEPKLKYAVILSRHGVRSPTWTAERLNQSSAQPWPDFGVPPGYLTEHGALLMRQFGEYYRAYFASHHLMQPDGCANSSRIYIWADNDQRTRETGKALAQGMLPGCAAEAHSLPDGQQDSLFNPPPGRVNTGDQAIALAAVRGRIGNNPQALTDLHQPAFEELARILGKPIPADPSTITAGKGETLVDVTGPLRTASTLTENLLLEYANGAKQPGWGRLNPSNLQQILVLHQAYADLVRRTPYLAQARGSYLLNHILLSIDQAVSGKAVPMALGKPGDLALIISGHDTNLSNISGILDLNWLLPGYQPNDPVPGGAIVFELWQTKSGYRLRAYYTAQSLTQMRDAIPLTVEQPPLRAPLFVPGCDGYDCDWTLFRRRATQARNLIRSQEPSQTRQSP